jgi:mannose-6-phosphate isomerase-like protein (cupin superfamily)
VRVWCLTLLVSAGALLIATCSSKPQYVHIGPDTLPAQSYDRPPTVRFDRSDYVIKLNQMTSFYDVPGETGYSIEGGDYGFDSLSFILTETHPQGGPPLHTHESEEAHVVLSGRVAYVIGDRRFTVDGPYIARVPAGVPHTFLNVGSEPFNLVATFPDKRLTYKELGPNPLVTRGR